MPPSLHNYEAPTGQCLWADERSIVGSTAMKEEPFCIQRAESDVSVVAVIMIIRALALMESTAIEHLLFVPWLDDAHNRPANNGSKTPPMCCGHEKGNITHNNLQPY